jgi:hypothetical protein
MRVRLMDMTHTVVFDSPELACFHEAGHAETAIQVGARVIEIELCREVPRSYGRCRIDRDDLQRKHIALGGFAVEYLLFKAGRLVKQDGQPPTEKEFINYAIGNASEDRVSYFGTDLTSPSGVWPHENDSEFMNYAIGRAKNRMRFDLVERIAAALLDAGMLDENAILAIAN